MSGLREGAAASPADQLTTTPIAGHLGVEVEGIDLGSDHSPEITHALRSALAKHQVLVFRDQSLTPESQQRFGESLGSLGRHPYVEPNAAHPDVVDIITNPDDTSNFGGGWHTDVTFLAEPDLGSILYAVDLPPYGGDTLFASQAAAYDALSETMKGMLEGLHAVHSASLQYGAGGYSTKASAVATAAAGEEGDSVHPVVISHPDTGRRALYVNPGFTTRIKGMRKSESDALLQFLFRHGVREEFTCRVHWRPGTAVIWDNRSVMHHALHDYAGHRRHMRRVTVRGTRPQP